VHVTPEYVRTSRPEGGPPVDVKITLVPHARVVDPIVALWVMRSDDGRKTVVANTQSDGLALGPLRERTQLQLRFEELGLEPGKYHLAVGVYERNWSYVYDWHDKPHALTVRGAPGGTFAPRRTWKID
jgi:hypothetical protein